MDKNQLQKLLTNDLREANSRLVSVKFSEGFKLEARECSKRRVSDEEFIAEYLINKGWTTPRSSEVVGIMKNHE